LQKQEIEALYQDLVDQINGEIALVKRRIEAEKVAEEQEKLRRLQVPFLPARQCSGSGIQCLFFPPGSGIEKSGSGIKLSGSCFPRTEYNFLS
jgi:hypothetical protein